MEEDDSHALLETLFFEIIANVESYDDLLVSLSNDDQMKSDYILHLVKCRTIVYSAALATLNEYCWKGASMRGDMRWQQMIEIAFWTPQEVGIDLECYDTSHRKARSPAIVLNNKCITMPILVSIGGVGARFFSSNTDGFSLLDSQILRKGGFHRNKWWLVGWVLRSYNRKVAQKWNCFDGEKPSDLQVLNRLLDARRGGKEWLIKQVSIDLKALLKGGGRGIKEASKVKPFKLTKSQASGGKRRGRARWSHKSTARPRVRRNSVAWCFWRVLGAIASFYSIVVSLKILK